MPPFDLFRNGHKVVTAHSQPFLVLFFSVFSNHENPCILSIKLGELNGCMDIWIQRIPKKSTACAWKSKISQNFKFFVAIFNVSVSEYFFDLLKHKKSGDSYFFLLNFFCISKPRRTHLLPYFLVTILLPYGLVFSCNLQTRATIISKTWWFTTP